MSAGKHTKAPWQRRWTSTSDGWKAETTGRIVDADGNTICDLVMTVDVDANARLLHAGPDLLAACKEALRTIDFGRPVEHPDIPAVRDMLADAIRTATGEAP